jgi:segregation and condensation protein A
VPPTIDGSPISSLTETPANESLDPEDEGSEATTTPEIPSEAGPVTVTAGATVDHGEALTDESQPAEAADTKAAIDTYGVNLDVFEGPLDLLLYLIRKSEVDIYDIPVARITAQYLAFLRGIHLLDLEGAADFILMAATLMKIKSQMLLPRDIEGEDLDEGIGDPREELVRKLLEYQQFKEIADWLSDQGTEQRDIYQRPGGLPEDTEDAELQPVSLFDLLKVYKHVIDHVPQAAVHRIVEEEVAIEECIERVLSELGQRSRLRFFDLISGQSRVAMVATFIGILELLKSQRIRVHQAQPFDDIWIEGREPDEDQPEADADAEGDAETGETAESDDTVSAEPVDQTSEGQPAITVPMPEAEASIAGAGTKTDTDAEPVASTESDSETEIAAVTSTTWGTESDTDAEIATDTARTAWGAEPDSETAQSASPAAVPEAGQLLDDELVDDGQIETEPAAEEPVDEVAVDHGQEADERGDDPDPGPDPDSEQSADVESGLWAADPADVSGEFESLTRSEFGSQISTPPALPGPEDTARDSTVSDADGEDPPAQTALASPEPDDLEADASRLVDAAERLGDQAVPQAPVVGQTVNQTVDQTLGQAEVREDEDLDSGSPIEEDSQAAGAQAPPPPAPGVDGLTGPEERA